MGNVKLIGTKLKQLREATGLRKSQVAEYLDIDQSYLSKTENGERAISTGQLEKMVEFYGYDLSVFEKEAEEPRPAQIALRVRDVSKENLQVMATISHIVFNCRFMKQLLKDNT